MRIVRFILALSAGISACGCNSSHSGNDSDAGQELITLSTTPGPWCGRDGAWRLTLSYEGVSPFDYPITVNQSVIASSSLPGCMARWYSNTTTCTYAFELECSTTDIQRIDHCELHVSSDTQMTGTCRQTVTSPPGSAMGHTSMGTGTATFTGG